jgi:nicotinamide mononucleotide transporter
MNFFDVRNIAVEIPGYPISYVEMIGTLSGLASVYFASRANILTWGTGTLNAIFLFILFYQVQLYPDMFLQVYFFVVTLYGWYNWKTNPAEKMIAEISFKSRLLLAAAIIVFTLLSGFFFSKIHLYLPELFRIQAAYPFVDSFVMVTSIAASILLAKRKIENWHLWIAINVICIWLYFAKQVYFLSLEYVIFLGLASYGLYNWNRQLKHG